jgi:hypothetical protein
MPVLLITTTVGPTELTAGRAYVHDIELDDGEELAIGMAVKVLDVAGRVFDAVVTGRIGALATHHHAVILGPVGARLAGSATGAH